MEANCHRRPLKWSCLSQIAKDLFPKLSVVGPASSGDSESVSFRLYFIHIGKYYTAVNIHRILLKFHYMNINTKPCHKRERMTEAKCRGN